MANIVIRHAVELDLEAIGDYIARDNPSRARSFLHELRGQIALLSDFPERYQIDLEVGENIRRMTHKRYRVYYRYSQQTDTVYVLRILSPQLSTDDFDLDE